MFFGAAAAGAPACDPTGALEHGAPTEHGAPPGALHMVIPLVLLLMMTLVPTVSAVDAAADAAVVVAVAVAATTKQFEAAMLSYRDLCEVACVGGGNDGVGAARPPTPQPLPLFVLFGGGEGVV